MSDLNYKSMKSAMHLVVACCPFKFYLLYLKLFKPVFLTQYVIVDMPWSVFYIIILLLKYAGHVAWESVG